VRSSFLESRALDLTQTIRDRALARTLPGSRHCCEQHRVPRRPTRGGVCRGRLVPCIMGPGWSGLHGQYTQLAYNSLQRPGARCGRHCSDVQHVRTGPGRDLSLDQNRLTALYCRALDASKRRGCRVGPPALARTSERL
jgi:hypothetical protein